MSVSLIGRLACSSVVAQQAALFNQGLRQANQQNHVAASTAASRTSFSQRSLLIQTAPQSFCPLAAFRTWSPLDRRHRQEFSTLARSMDAQKTPTEPHQHTTTEQPESDVEAAAAKAAEGSNASAGQDEPARFSPQWWFSKGVEMTIFAVTGSTTAFCVRPLLGVLDIHGSLIDGPWSYRLASIFIMTPSYSLLFLLVSALFGRAAWGRMFVGRMWARPLRLINKIIAPK